MEDNKKIDDLEWPTFEPQDTRTSYSPDTDRENIFTDFQPATEKHIIKNKKRKPKKQPSRSLRLISESDINKRTGPCAERRCLVIVVLVVSIVIAVAICIAVGVYFGVKGGESAGDGGKAESVVDVNLLTSTVGTTRPVTPPVTPLVTKHIETVKPTPSKSSSTTTSSSTSSSTTSTTTTTTTTTTSTTTTPAPTEPPVKEYSGSKEDTTRIVDVSTKCAEKTILSTDRLKVQQKCNLYYKMLTCAYVELIKQQLYVQVDDLAEVVENRTSDIFSIWIEIQPRVCRDENESVNIRNISSLPTELSALCTSPDVLLYHGQHQCNLIKDASRLAGESDENKCRIQWGTVGCVAETLGCTFAEVAAVLDTHGDSILQPLQLSTVNQTYCAVLYDDMSRTSPCSLQLYKYMEPIFSGCTDVIKQGSFVVAALPNITCTLFEEFFRCSYEKLPVSMRREQCDNDKDSLRPVVMEIAAAAASVNRVPPFLNVTECIDTPMPPMDICQSPTELVAVVDSRCYSKFRFLTTDSKTCKSLSDYIYVCGPEYLQQLGVTCTVDNIRSGLMAESDLVQSRYGFNVVHKLADEKCVAPP